jgi:AhpD family alkylhydroperoxidase
MTSAVQNASLALAAPEHSSLRLAPIDQPRSWLVRLFNWLMRWRFGKVMMPSRVIYSRWPTLLWRQGPLYHLVDRGLSIDQDLRHLIEVQVSTLNGCTFCADLHSASAALHKVRQQKLAALYDYETNDLFSPRERAALAYVSEIARDNHVTDPTFATLRSQFNETEIIEITWLQAFTTYLNKLAIPLGIGSDGFCEVLAKG